MLAVAGACLIPLLSVMPASAADHPKASAPDGPPAVSTPNIKGDQVRIQPGAAGIRASHPAWPAPFLTRPYWDWHGVSSIFDHCNPTYAVDGVICYVDGTRAYRSNGADPSFPLGYPVTPGGTDYLYYDGHNGWDIMLSYETLLAAAPGTVTYAGWDYPGCGTCGYGQTVIIDHGNGISTRYGHMSQIWVTVGQHVQRAQPIGVSGQTGNATGPHLHFGVYINSSWTAIDPWGWQGSGADPWPYDEGNLWIGGNPLNPQPSAPTNVHASAGDGVATVSWTAPSFDGGTAITGYRVTASPGGATLTVGGGSTTATLTGLTDGTAYTFQVVATDSNWNAVVGSNAGSGLPSTSPASASSNSVVPVPAWPGQYHPSAPTRILDTRNGTGGITGPVGWGQTISVPIAGRGPVPATGAAAVVLNVTATDPTRPGFLTLFPSGQALPATSNINFGVGDTVANLVQVPIGADGRVDVYNPAGNTDVVMDVEGWVSGASTSSGPSGHYGPLPVPVRVYDSRKVSRRLTPGASVNLTVAGVDGVPADASAVVVNLTATDTTGPGYMTAYPAGTGQPLASNLNYKSAQTIANRAVVEVGSAGQITIKNVTSSSDLVVDLEGWYSGASGVPAGGLFTGITPTRLLDTRNGTGGITGPVGPGQSISVTVAGHGGVPSMGAATPPAAVLVNITTTDTTLPSYMTAWPDQASRPLTSDLNWPTGQTVANLALVKVGPDGKIALYNAVGNADVVVDLMGWYSP